MNLTIRFIHPGGQSFFMDHINLQGDWSMKK